MRAVDRRSYVRVVAALSLAVLAPGCARETTPVVVWIEVDTLRADALGCYGSQARGEHDAPPSPNLDALAAEGVLFERAYATAPWTIPSLVSQLSGAWPWEHGCRRLLEVCPEASTALVPAIAAAGWRTLGVMTNFIATRRYGYARGFEHWDDAFAQGHEGSSAEPAVARLIEFVERARDDPGRGLFLFAWLFEPHYRYEEHPGLRFGAGHGSRAGEVYTGSLRGDEELNDLLRRRGDLDSEDAAFLRGRYTSEVAAVDRALGTLFAALRERGLYDDAWIVFTADHGEEILDRGWIGHASTLHEELVRVPLIVRPPRALADGVRGRRISHPVSLIDLPATLHEIATGRAPDRARGELGHSTSLVPTILDGARPERRWIYLHTDFEPVLQDATAAEKRAHQWGVVDAHTGLKWIVDHKTANGARPRGLLYDLDDDPLETNPLAWDGAMPSVHALQRLRGLVPEPLDGARPAPATLPEEAWIAAPAGLDGFGPGFEPAPR